MIWAFELTLNDGIHRAALLAVAAVNALGHINIVTGRPAASILTLLGLNGDSLGRADGLAELASNATFLTGGIAAEGVFTTETGRDGTLLEGVEDGVANTGHAISRLLYFDAIDFHGLPSASPARFCGTRTYGGLKNCSSTTYMPRKISDMRKYLLALSKADSES